MEKLSLTEITKVVESLVGFNPDQRHGWFLYDQENALTLYESILDHMLGRYIGYISAKTDRAGDENLYNYGGERSKKILNLLRGWVDYLENSE